MTMLSCSGASEGAWRCGASEKLGIISLFWVSLNMSHVVLAAIPMTFFSSSPRHDLKSEEGDEDA